MASESSSQTPQRADNGTEQDNAFMAMCLQHINPDTKKIDMGAVAEALGYTNAKSAGNRFSAIKKRYPIHVEVAYPRADGTIPKASPKKVQKSTPKRVRKRKAEALTDSDPKEPESKEPESKEPESKEPESKEPESKDDDANGEKDKNDEDGKPNPDEV